MTPEEKQTPTPEGSPVRFFAGWQNCEDMVSGGTGLTLEEAVMEYFQNCAADECDEAFGDEPGDFELEIWSCVNEEEARAKGFGEDWGDNDWIFMLLKKIEVRKYRCERVPNEKFSDLPDWKFSREQLTH